MPLRLLAVIALLPLWAACRSPDIPVEVDPRIETVESFRAACARADFESARRLLAAQPRLWYGEAQGEGLPWTPGSGPWRGWDEHFRGHSERVGPWHVDGDTVWAEFHETNDYYRLLERGGGYWRGTYSFDGDGAIAGLCIGASPGREVDLGRLDEFLDWARRERPEELDYLMPDGEIDPSGDRPPRTRALLEAWRASVGLPPLVTG